MLWNILHDLDALICKHKKSVEPVFVLDCFSVRVDDFLLVEVDHGPVDVQVCVLDDALVTIMILGIAVLCLVLLVDGHVVGVDVILKGISKVCLALGVEDLLQE